MPSRTRSIGWSRSTPPRTASSSVDSALSGKRSCLPRREFRDAADPASMPYKATPTSSTQNGQQARTPTRPSRCLGRVQVLPQQQEPTRRPWCCVPYQLDLHWRGSLTRQDRLGLIPQLSRTPRPALSLLPTRPCPPHLCGSTPTPSVRSRPRRSESSASWARQRRSLRHASPLPLLPAGRRAALTTVWVTRSIDRPRQSRRDKEQRHPNLRGTCLASVPRWEVQRARLAGL